MNNGQAASLQDNSAHGEDRFLMRELSDTVCLDAVLDGVTHCEGGYASGFTVQILQDAPILTLEDLLAALEQANETLFQSGKGRNLLTTVSATLKTDGELHAINIGDSSIYLARSGCVSELSTITSSDVLTSLANGAVGLRATLDYKYRKIDLEPGDRLVLATDGLINNVFPEEILDIIQTSLSADDAVPRLERLVAVKRRSHVGREDLYGTFREDDRTVVVRYLD